MFERSGDSVLSIDCPRIPALAHFLLQSSHLPFQALDSIERIVEAGGVHRLQEGADGREGAAKFPLLWSRWFAVSVIGNSSIASGQNGSA